MKSLVIGSLLLGVVYLVMYYQFHVTNTEIYFLVASFGGYFLGRIVSIESLKN